VTGLSDGAPITYVWNDAFDPSAVAAFDGETYVVGGFQIFRYDDV